jgi:tripartite-type tricarboxylate transporter receptor subunit TctC
MGSAYKRRSLVGGSAIVLAAVGSPALSDPVADFYKGKQLQMVVRTTVGGGYDSLSRLIGRHIGRHVPGQPTVVVQNMPGGGGLQAANYMGARAPQDGTVVSIIGQGVPVDQALGLNKSLTADMRTLVWIANMGGSNQVLAVWHTSQTKTLADARRRETLIGTAGTGSISVQMPSIYNAVLGTRFKLVIGYPGGVEIDLAMERGEVEGRGTNPWNDYVSAAPRLVKEKLINIIIQVGLTREPDLPQVPTLLEEAQGAGRAVAEFMTKAVAVGRPLATTPNVPADRVAALRKAVKAMVDDPEFKKDAERSSHEIRYQPGEELARMINDLLDAPASLRENVRQAMEPPKDSQQVGKK